MHQNGEPVREQWINVITGKLVPNHLAEFRLDYNDAVCDEPVARSAI
jgi:hypothetical protein